MATTYIYLDESGNLDFNNTGSRHFVLCAMITSTVAETQGLLHCLKSKLLEDGVDKEYFHATEDRQFVRNKVFQVMVRATE